MKRLCAFVLLALLAGGAARASVASAYGRFLPPDQAFRLHATATPGAVLLDWNIADGYYLYRKRFKFVAPVGTVGAPQFPQGDVENDPNFGQVEVYRHHLQVKLPVEAVPADGRLVLTVTYQGCADAGLCYAPITQHLTLNIKAAQAAGGGTLGAGAGPPGSGTTIGSEQTRLANLVTHANPLWFFVVFFALGVLLAFTPCVLPMVPILAGILGGERGIGTRRGFALSLVYVLAMAAVYTAAGVAAGFAGTGLQGFFQAPWVIGLFSAIFVALALSLFGLYELRLPNGLTSRINALSGRHGGGWAGAAVMGALAALIVSPCVAAPLAGALVAIGRMGEPVRGGIALAALALGMGAPLVVYGTVAGRLLPKAGRWMVLVERFLGIVMLAYAAWLLGRVVPGQVTLILWGAIGLLAAFMLGAFRRPFGAGRGFARGAGVVAGLAGLILIAGGATGGSNPLAPFAGLRPMPEAQAMALHYRPVASLAALQAQLAGAARAARPVMVEFRADWCTACLEMEHTTLKAPAVRRALAKMALFRVDVTDNTPAERKLLKHFGLYGPPAYLFFDRCGRPLHAQDIAGYLAANRFLPHVHAALGGMAAARAVADRAGGLHCASVTTGA